MIIKNAIYNKGETECLQIGYFLNNQREIQIIPFHIKTKKVPSILPKEITSLKGAFESNNNVKIIGLDKWDTSNVTDMSEMFLNAKFFNQSIKTKNIESKDGIYIAWNTKNVKSMRAMFKCALSFNQDISNWDTSNVTDMSLIFSNHIDNKDVFNENRMRMKFNKKLNTWNMSNVNNMLEMFKNAENFNQDISNWNVSNVTNMSGMFDGAKRFNRNISNWDVSKVKDMTWMFYGAENFKKDLSNWNVKKVRKFDNFAEKTNLKFTSNLYPKFGNEDWEIKKLDYSLKYLPLPEDVENDEIEQNFAVIDIETNHLRNVISIGVVIGNSIDFSVIDQNYWVIENNLKDYGMFNDRIAISSPHYAMNYVEVYEQAIEKLIEFLNSYNVKDWFSYTKFDYNILTELRKNFNYYDISIIAKNIHFNDSLSKNADTNVDGSLRKGYGVEQIYRQLSRDRNYQEEHNALLDAIDELKIMRMLELSYKAFKVKRRIKRYN